MPFLKFICTNYKGNIAMDLFLTSSFQVVVHASSWISCHLAGVIWSITLTPRRFAFVSHLGYGRLMSNLHFYDLHTGSINIPGHGESFSCKLDRSKARPILAKDFCDLGIFNFSLPTSEQDAHAI